MEIIKRADKKIICRLSGLYVVSNEFLASLVWLDGVDRYIVTFKVPVAEEWCTLSQLTGIDKAWMVYSAVRAEFENGVPEISGEITETSMPEPGELAALFMETRAEYYRAMNRELTERQVVESRNFTENALPKSRRLCLKKNGRPVALLILTEAKDYEGVPVDWVPWVWVDKALDVQSRAMVHARFVNWMKAGRLDRIQCSVASGNVRSQKFFRKLGFKPECLHILK